MMKDTRWPEIPLLALRGAQLFLGLLCLAMAGNLIDTYSAQSFWEFNIVLVCGLFSMIYAAINFGLFYINLLLPLAIVITDAFMVVLWLVAVAGLGDFLSRNGIFDVSCSAYDSSMIRNPCNVIKAAWVFAFFSFLVFCATTALASYVLHKNRKDLRGAKYNSGMDPNGSELENGQTVAPVQEQVYPEHNPVAYPQQVQYQQHQPQGVPNEGYYPQSPEPVISPPQTPAPNPQQQYDQPQYAASSPPPPPPPVNAQEMPTYR